MDDTLYDEFGNYVGPDLDSSDDEEEEEVDNGGAETAAVASDSGGVHVSDVESDEEMGDAIVLHEDKKYYPDANEVYPDAEVIVQDEDAQSIEEPIIAPVKRKSFSVLDTNITATKTHYSQKFMLSLLQRLPLIRNIALIGHFHHGKTTLADVLVEQTLEEKWDPAKNMRYLDTRLDEQARELSIKALSSTLVLPDSDGKHYLVNLMDTPGHVNFSGESVAALRACDGAVVVVDAVEGVMLNTERMIKSAVQANVSIMLCITKIDRLIHELKLPPTDAYFKLLFTIDQVNTILKETTHESSPTRKVCPRAGNVCFASGINGFCFTLESFAKIYINWYNMEVDSKKFANRLWGDIYYNPNSRKFVDKRGKRKPKDGEDVPQGMPRSFVHFILEPIYKIYSHVLGEEPTLLKKMLKKVGIKLQPQEYTMDAKPLLKLVLSRFFEGKACGFVDMVVNSCNSPEVGAEAKIRNTYTGDLDLENEMVKGMMYCDPRGPLVIQAVKLYSTPDASSFVTFGRILSGTVKVGQKVRVLGENYTLQDDEDMATCTVSGVSINQGRYRIDVDQAPCGNWVLLDGVDATITKTATIVEDSRKVAQACIFKPLQFNTSAVVKLAVEPLNPSELPKMLAGLRSVNKTYLLLHTKVEESGEHVIYGTGELFLDCVMHDLREMYSEIEIKIADPIVSFRETVVETSSLKCFAETPNQKNKVTLIAEPLESGLAEDLERGHVRIDAPKRELSKFFTEKYGWDILASRSVWAFGPEENGCNILLDDTLPGEVDKKLLSTVQSNLVQGFKWGCREGPLCDEPIRNVKFRILDISLAEQALHRGGGQIIPTARRVVYSSFLTASPRLMEPMFYFEIQTPADMIDACAQVVTRRRGNVSKDEAIPGSPFFLVKGYLPVIDSFGFETDLRAYTRGSAFVLQVFDHWSVVPGDPMDDTIVLQPLEPSKPFELAREFMVKTRRRKGLGEDVSVKKYFDEEMLEYLEQQEKIPYL